MTTVATIEFSDDLRAKLTTPYGSQEDTLTDRPTLVGFQQGDKYVVVTMTVLTEDDAITLLSQFKQVTLKSPERTVQIG